MLARYLGSKTSILTPLMNTIAEYAVPGDHVVDAFSGSLAVSLAMKNEGYRVTANDINLFSSVFADAYLLNHEPPTPDLSSLFPSRRAKLLLGAAASVEGTLTGKPGFAFLNKPAWRERYVRYLAILEHLNSMTEVMLPANHRLHHFYDTYCEAGQNSAFVSSRGTQGMRRFFTPENAVRIDLILNQLRAWTQAGAIDAHTRALLTAGLVRAVEMVANTQGTFHDFIRTGWDSRALHSLRMRPMPLDSAVDEELEHRSGCEEDTLEFIKSVSPHQVLYLDPPYNFRQYTAYYFLANLICRYADLPDPDHYFAKVKFVRGQNPDDDFSSTFCKANRFIDEMRLLISRAQCSTVIISYYTGANHWGSFDTTPDNTGRQHLTELLTGELFVPGTFRSVEVPRRNYASYGGFKARQISELLLVAEKRQNESHASRKGVH